MESTARSETDRIEKTIVLRAPRARVWRALTDAGEFGAWFGASLTGTFAPGGVVRGQITTPGYEHLTMELLVERVEPERLLAFRWQPSDVASDPMTLVEFHLEEVADGTRLTVIESGFDRLSTARRAEVYRSNEGGWSIQLENIARHVAA